MSWVFIIWFVLSGHEIQVIFYIHYLSLLRSNQTFLAKLDTSLHRRELKYEPSDHLAVFPANSDALVNAIIPRLKEMPEDPEHTVFAVEILADSTSHGETNQMK